MTTAQAAQLRDRAIAAARAGDGERASALFDQAVASAPSDASILNSAANHWARSGDTERATRLLKTAVAVEPKAAEPLLNLAILLTGAGDAAGALDLLRPQEHRMGKLRRYWSIRAGAERAIGAKRDALASHERAVSIEPAHPAALEGRARLALETGVDAREHYRAALAAAPGQATAVLGYGQAL
nr:tetratricopeptide repeat protein [Sphingomonas sp.]